MLSQLPHLLGTPRPHESVRARHGQIDRDLASKFSCGAGQV